MSLQLLLGPQSIYLNLSIGRVDLVKHNYGEFTKS